MRSVLVVAAALGCHAGNAVVDLPAQPTALAVSDSRVYALAGGVVHEVDPAARSARALPSAGFTAIAAGSDGGVYGFLPGDGTITDVLKRTRVAEPSLPVTEMVADGEHVFAIERDVNSFGTAKLLAVSLGTGAVQEVDARSYGPIALGGDSVCWRDLSSNIDCGPQSDLTHAAVVAGPAVMAVGSGISGVLWYDFSVKAVMRWTGTAAEHVGDVPFHGFLPITFGETRDGAVVFVGESATSTDGPGRLLVYRATPSGVVEVVNEDVRSAVTIGIGPAGAFYAYDETLRRVP